MTQLCEYGTKSREGNILILKYEMYTMYTHLTLLAAWVQHDFLTCSEIYASLSYLPRYTRLCLLSEKVKTPHIPTFQKHEPHSSSWPGEHASPS
jgi:hypothetical protein